jgi:hypothetical protein
LNSENGDYFGNLQLFLSNQEDIDIYINDKKVNQDLKFLFEA